jgi:hypothetical protein
MLFIKLLPLIVSSYIYLDNFKKSLTIIGYLFAITILRGRTTLNIVAVTYIVENALIKALVRFKNLK